MAPESFGDFLKKQEKPAGNDLAKKGTEVFTKSGLKERQEHETDIALKRQQAKESAFNRIAHAKNYEELFSLLRTLDRPKYYDNIIEEIEKAADNYIFRIENNDSNEKLPDLSFIPRSLGEARERVEYFLSKKMKPPGYELSLRDLSIPD